MKTFQNVFKEDSNYKLFFLSLLTTGIAYGIHKGIIDNYLAEVVAMGELDRGITEFFRELPGFLLVFILATFYFFSAEKLYQMGAIIMVVGMSMIALVPPTKILVMLAIFLYSLGEHIQLGMKNTISLEYSKKGHGGQALGYQNAVHQCGMLLGYAVIIVSFIFLSSKKPFKLFFLIAAAIFAIGMVISFGLTSKSETDKTKSRFYFRKKYTKYYILEIFYGARKQVFFTFGPYVLILFYKANATVISSLFAVTAILCFLLSSFVGKIIDKLGYKIVMISDTLILIVVCFFYGFAHHIFPMHIAFLVCCANYVLDSIISMASMASNVYVQAISDSSEEVKATISTGISVNHLITLFVALFGGWIWQTLGIETLFILSAIFGLCNSIFAAFI